MPSLQIDRGIRVDYDAFGSPSDPTVLLVAGLGSQSISWDEAFCERLVAGGRQVIRFDNRDCGHSTWFDDAPLSIAALQRAAATGGAAAVSALAPYDLSDMADDAFGLLGGLGVRSAHVVGASMGGAIAQTMAIERPERLRTLTSMMANTGEAAFGRSSPEAEAVLLAPAPSDREGFVRAAEARVVYQSKRYGSAALARQAAAEAYDRAYYPAGIARQLAAIVASGSRAEGLRALTVPTLVIHGTDDTLIEPSGGERTAELVPDATLLVVADMGHDRPRELWPTLCGAILEHTARHEPPARQR